MFASISILAINNVIASFLILIRSKQIINIIAPSQSFLGRLQLKGREKVFISFRQKLGINIRLTKKYLLLKSIYREIHNHNVAINCKFLHVHGFERGFYLLNLFYLCILNQISNI